MYTLGFRVGGEPLGRCDSQDFYDRFSQQMINASLLVLERASTRVSITDLVPDGGHAADVSNVFVEVC
jgi:hypothetical protein